MKRSIFLVILAFVVGLAGPAFAEGPGPGTQVVKTANETIKTQLKSKATAAKVTASVRDFIDLDELGKRALVDHWDKLTTDQQKEYQKTLRELIEANYVKGMKANVDYTIEYTGESTASGGEIIVTTIVKAKRKGRPIKISIDYTLTKDSAGKLRASDVSTDGVGLVKNYRAQYNKIINKSGFDDLIARMKKQAAQLGTAEPAPKS
jgi:phospholipid transport system substrate-binding protein